MARYMKHGDMAMKYDAGLPLVTLDIPEHLTLQALHEITETLLPENISRSAVRMALDGLLIECQRVAADSHSLQHEDMSRALYWMFQGCRGQLSADELPGATHAAR